MNICYLLKSNANKYANINLYYKVYLGLGYLHVTSIISRGCGFIVLLYQVSYVLLIYLMHYIHAHPIQCTEVNTTRIGKTWFSY